MRVIPLFLLSLLLAACESGPKPGEALVVYACDDGQTLRVLFSDQNARVTLPSKQEVVLPLQPAASGIAYGTPQHQLRGKGDEATWTEGKRVAVMCHVAK